MSIKIKKIAGFTLVEMLVAMAIFVTFTGILINSYSSIVRAQREANFYREMYVSARQIFETLILELRDGMVDYPQVNSVDLKSGEIFLISKDAMSKSHIFYQDNTVKLAKKYLSKDNKPGPNANYDPEEVVTLNFPDKTGVKITKFKLYFSPSIDPYDPKFVDYDKNQFQPMVTIYAEFEKEFLDGKKYSMDLQTTVSSRIYNQVYPTVDIYKLNNSG